MTPTSILSLLRLLPLLALLAFVSANNTGSQGINLVPLPFKSTVGNTVTCLADNFKVTFQCGGKNKAPKDLRDAAERMVENLRASKMRYLSPSYGAEFFPKGPKCEHKITELKITVNDGDNTIASHATKPVETRAATEGYKLSIPADGSATVSADTALGAFRGLVSFENLFYKIGRDGNLDLQQGDEDNDHGRWNVKKDIAYAPFAPYELDDKPQFPWRSVLLDTSRNYFRKEKLFKMLDAMSKVKLNVFHWHITDSQSWPLDLKAMPELVKGAYQGSRIYSESDVKEIVAYAAARGIDVVIEIDTPGHTASLYASHPEYIACNEASPWAKNANEPPAGQLRFADDEVTAFTSKIFANTIALTQSAYFGTGGDELNLNCMNNDGPTNATLQAKGWTLMDALREFTNKTHNTLLENKRTPMVWEEMVLDHGELNVVKDTIVDVWISSANVRAVADKGYRVVHASSDYFYLDCGHGGWVGKDGGLNSVSTNRANCSIQCVR